MQGRRGESLLWCTASQQAVRVHCTVTSGSLHPPDHPTTDVTGLSYNFLSLIADQHYLQIKASWVCLLHIDKGTCAPHYCLATVTTLGSRKWERAALASQAELLLSFSLTASLSSCNPGCLYVTTSPLCVSCPDVNKEELHTSHCTRKLEHSLTPGITKPRRRWLLSVCLAKILYLLHTEWIFSIHGFRKTEALWKLSNKSDIITLGLPVSHLGVQLTE